MGDTFDAAADRVRRVRRVRDLPELIVFIVCIQTVSSAYRSDQILKIHIKLRKEDRSLMMMGFRSSQKLQESIKRSFHR